MKHPNAWTDAEGFVSFRGGATPPLTCATCGDTDVAVDEDARCGRCAVRDCLACREHFVPEKDELLCAGCARTHYVETELECARCGDAELWRARSSACRKCGARDVVEVRAVVPSDRYFHELQAELDVRAWKRTRRHR